MDWPASLPTVLAALAGLGSLLGLGHGLRSGGLMRGFKHVGAGIIALFRANTALEICRQDKADLAQSNALLRQEMTDLRADFGGALRAGSTNASPANLTPSPVRPSKPISPRPKRSSARVEKSAKPPGS